jgi:hypothetical protein
MKRGFVLHHNGPPARCIGQPHSRCVAFWNAVKAFHQQKWPNSNDIAYSFGVCPHGIRFVGRGWDKNQFAGGTDVVGHDDGPDSAWYSVLAFVGGDTSTGDTEPPTDAMVNGVIALIDEGRDSGRCERRVLPHSAFKPKPCPGPEFTALSRRWDNAPLIGPTNGGPTQEDDMPLTETDLDAVEARSAAAARGELRRWGQFITTGAGSALTADQPWVANAVTLPKLLTAVAGIDVDEAMIATALAPGLTAALVAAVPGVTDLATTDEVEERFRVVLTDVFGAAAASAAD